MIAVEAGVVEKHTRISISMEFPVPIRYAYLEAVRILEVFRNVNHSWRHSGFAFEAE